MDNTFDMDSLTLHPIGHISTPFHDRYDAPRQPGMGAESTEGMITLLPGYNFEQALEDLAGFEKIWVIYWFHRNTTWKPKVLPPRSGDVRRGLFATRSPHRPNPIGLSLLTLIEIKGRTLRVANTDLLNGTPILDIKPYLPYAEAFPDVQAGWIDKIIEKEQSISSYTIEWSALASEQAEWLHSAFDLDLMRAVSVLQHSPFPHPYRRIEQRSDGGLVLAVKSWRILFTKYDASVLIERLESGYTLATVLEAVPGSLHNHEAHTGFHQRWPAL